MQTDGRVRKWANAALGAANGSRERAMLKIAADAMLRGYSPTSPRVNLAFRYLDEMGSRVR